MTLKEVASVIDDINEWKNPHREGEFVYYVTAFFTDGEVGSAGRKDMDAALEVQGLLQEAIGQELDFTLEPKAPTKSGKPAWKILGFGTPGGAATYTAPGVQGGGAEPRGPSAGVVRTARSPEHDQFIQERMDRRTALMQAVNLPEFAWEPLAEQMYAWLRKTSDASSAYPSTDSPSVTPADASEDSGGGVESEGKEPAPPSHIHDWQPHPNLRNKLKCECGEMRNKEAAK